ncbi:hypothetical protein C8A00DRAFT_43669 [Chaetomidium leptoderma]|uniref:NADAR domain-containing protein n=1 Tax=Chaetomidium leptoderma TaxID=669021 RepID=A0AAN6VKR9_9PEZI|nr:hypothetical protein C8A00DRAFT_43669 [Chaetomidium leptoderma]
MPPKTSKPQHRVTKRTKPTRSKKTPRKPQTPIMNNNNNNNENPSTSPVYFWRETDPSVGYLSQWYPCAFTDDTNPSIIYPTAEHYMMYQKALLFSDPAVGAEILAAGHPRAVKALGRKVANFDEAVWKARREAIVRKGSLLKFTRPVDVDDGQWVVVQGQGEGEGEGEGEEGLSLRELLLRTGEREIVEASPMDRIWGIGFGAARAGTVRARWGLNLLGKALMVVRGELREEEIGKKGGEVPSEAKASEEKEMGWVGTEEGEEVQN